MVRKFFLICVLTVGLLFGLQSKAADQLNVYFFYGEGCPHCAKEEVFLRTVQKTYPEVEVKSFEIYHNSENATLLKQVANLLGANVNGVPFSVIGDKYFIGYTQGITSSKIENRINECLESECTDAVGALIEVSKETDETDNSQDMGQDAGEEMISLSILGKINATTFSLPIITIVLGALDGFNPCAMWTLLFLISLLLGTGNKKRMWVLGSAFIVASAFVYFLFMSAWLNLIIFLGLIFWIRVAIGLVALLGGGYSLREFWVNKKSVCKITNNGSRQRVFQKIRAVIERKSFVLALCGIIALAFVVNLVELVCSAGLPAVYTQILALNGLSTWQYYAYILLYILFFMADDLFVFFLAMKTLQITGLSTKYVRHSRLIGGVLMVAIGLLLIFRPELLMFG